jgi:cytoskeletal protein CcmA (bactofilin family)
MSMSIRDFMARSERGLETPAEVTMPTSLPAPRMVATSTSVDASSELEGRLRSVQTVRIDGRVKGAVECEKSVLIGETARVFASIAAEEVQIAGLVEGDIAARRKITLQKTAVVKGDLTTPGIVIEEGAQLKGRIVIGTDAEAVIEAAAQPEPAKDAKKSQAAHKSPAPAAKPAEPPAAPRQLPTSA